MLGAIAGGCADNSTLLLFEVVSDLTRLWNFALVFFLVFRHRRLRKHERFWLIGLCQQRSERLSCHCRGHHAHCQSV